MGWTGFASECGTGESRTSSEVASLATCRPSASSARCSNSLSRREPFRLLTIPSSPSRQACSKTSGPSTSKCPTPSEHSLQCRLAHFERFAPQVVTVQLDQIEGVQKGAGVMAAIANPVELRRRSSPFSSQLILSGTSGESTTTTSPPIVSSSATS